MHTEPRRSFLGRKEKTMKVHINYLYLYARKLTELKNELLHLQDIAEVTADLDDATDLHNALEELRVVVDSLPLA